jgi:class 3 adenylate cyclase
VTELAGNALEAGRAAVLKHAWRDAYEHLRTADAEGTLSGEDLQSLGEAAWWTGHLEEALVLRERAYAAYVGAGQSRTAGALATQLSMDHLLRGTMSVSSGWLARAGSLLADEEEGFEHGYLSLARGLSAQTIGELETATAEFGRAHDLAVRFSDGSLRALAVVFKGTVLVATGDLTEGLRLLEEATAAAVSGELEPLATGIVYCVMIDSCQALGDCGRAAEWTTAANHWCDRLDVTGFPGACRIHRAQILQLQGDWPRAEEQAIQACAELQDYNHFVTAQGFYEIGEIRRRRGDFSAAEEAYRQANELGRDPQPGLALLRLAQGKVDTAAAAIKRDLAQEWLDPLSRAKRLPAQIEISLAAGELRRAREAAEELDGIADQFRVGGRRTPALDGAVRVSWGQIRLAERDWEGAASALRAARDVWEKVGAPYEIAQTRMLLGLAYRGEGDEDGAREELTAAKRTFERLGAVLDVQRIAELLGESATRRTFMFTDIVDSTKLVDALGEEKWQKLLSWHDRKLRELIEGAGGEVIKHTGDGYFAAFGAPAAAVEAAATIQRALDEHEPLAPDVRIGLHTGGALHKADGDYSGQGVHMAARIGALAAGGEILISGESLDGGTRFRLSEPRSEQLKGFEDPVELVAVEWR